VIKPGLKTTRSKGTRAEQTDQSQTENREKKKFFDHVSFRRGESEDNSVHSLVVKKLRDEGWDILLKEARRLYSRCSE